MVWRWKNRRIAPNLRSMVSSSESAPDPPSAFARRFPSAFVTGGSSGLGRVFVESLHAEGVEVWAGSRSADRLNDAPKGVRPVELDLSDRDSVAAFLGNPPWSATPALLFNNAGYGDFGRLETIPPGRLRLQLTTMLESAMLLSRYFLGSTQPAGSSGIVNVSSLSVEFPLPFLHGYNAVKAGLSGFSRSLALEFPGGKRTPFVIDLRPGDFRTAFNDSVRREYPRQDREIAGVWDALEHHLQNGADPAGIWPPVRNSLLSGKSRTVRVGTFFQARVAPMFAKTVPESLLMWAHRRYYRMKKG